MRFVAFDLDGTLVDSRAAIVGCFQHSLASQGVTDVADAAIAARIGLPLAQMLTGLVDPAVEPACIEVYKRDFKDWDRRLTLPFDGVIDVLTGLRAAGRTTMVTSSKSLVGVTRVVTEQKMDHLFDALYGGDSVSRGKPHPEMLQTAMARAGVGPQDTVIVGDTTYDIEMGLAAGAHTIGVAWGMHGPDRLADVGAHVVVESAEALGEALG